MLRNILLYSVFCLIICVSVSFGQKPEPENETPRAETREQSRPPDPPPAREESRPVETSRPESRPTESPRNDDNSSRRDNSRNEESRADRHPRRTDDSNPPDRESRRKPRNDDDERPRQPRNRDGNDDGRYPGREGERPRYPKERDGNKPPKVNPHPLPIVSESEQYRREEEERNREWRRREWERREWERQRREQEERDRIFGIPTNTTQTTPSINAYFDKDDFFAFGCDTYVDPDSQNYLPYFESSLSQPYQPLFYVYGREFFVNEFRFVTKDWTFYYEPDLDDVFVNFSKCGTVFERMVWYPLGKTIGKVDKRFKNQGQEARPTIVENLEKHPADRLYSFNVHELPKGEYEIRFFNRSGATFKQLIRLK